MYVYIIPIYIDLLSKRVHYSESIYFLIYNLVLKKCCKSNLFWGNLKQNMSQMQIQSYQYEQIILFKIFVKMNKSIRK